MGKSIKCLSNLRQLGTATTMYAGEHKNFLPYPTTTQGEKMLWFNCLDPYLKTLGGNNRTGVAGTRDYTSFKQCVVWDEIEGGVNITGAQNAGKEFARTYKMNSHLRHNNPYKAAKITQIRDSTTRVLYGDATSLDQSGPVDSQWESGQFSFEVDDKTQAGPALRHMGGANIVYVDGHAEHVVCKTITKNLRAPQSSVVVKSWESQFVDGSGNPASPPDARKPAAAQGLRRNPNMPLTWGDPGLLYR